MPLVTLTPFRKATISAEAYYEYMMALSPAAYWRLGETVPLSIDDDFTGTDGDPPNEELWITNIRTSDEITISNDKLKFISDGTLVFGAASAIEAIYDISGDFDIQVECELVNTSATDEWVAQLDLIFAANIKSSSGYIRMSRNATNTKTYAGRATIVGVKQTFFADPTTDSSGYLRIRRIGTTLDGMYSSNGSAWTTLWTHGDTPTGNVFRVYVRQYGAQGPITEVHFDNFIVNSGHIFNPTAIDETGTYHGTYDGILPPSQNDISLIVDDTDTSTGFDRTLGQQITCGETVGNIGIRSIVASFKLNTTFDSTAADYQAIFIRWDDDGDGTLDEDNYGLYLDRSTGQLAFIRFIGVDFSGVILSDQVSWNGGQTYHVVATIDSENGMILYVDGIKQQSTHASTAAVSSILTSNSTIGHWGEYVGENRTFDGVIDDVALFTTTISQSEVEDLYRLSKGWTLLPTTYQDTVLYNIPVAYWRFGEVSGTDAYDEVGYYDGTYINQPTLGATSLIINDSNTAVNYELSQLEHTALGDTFPIVVDKSISVLFSVNFTDDTTTLPVISKMLDDFTGYVIDIHSTIRLLIRHTTATNELDVASIATLNINTTYHIVVTLDGSNLASGVRIYINAVDQPLTISDDTWTTTPTYGIQDTYIGRRYQDGGDLSMAGTLDEVALFNHTLTQNDVTDLYRSSIGFNPSVSNYQNQILLLAPIAYWRLGETVGTLAEDELLNNNGTYTNAPTLGATSLVTNDGNPAADFDGTNQYVNMGTGLNNQIGTGDMSITYLVNYDSVSSTWRTVQNRGTGLFGSDLPGFQISGDASFFNTYVQTSANTYVQLSSAIYLAINTTYHVTVTYEKATAAMLLYVDGVFKEAGTIVGSPQGQDYIATGSLSLAIAANDLTQPLDGTLDEVAIFDKVLTPTEITDLYQKSIGN